MKKIISLFLIIVLFSCSQGFFTDANKGGFNSPSLVTPVPSRVSGEYYTFNLSFQTSVNFNVKYIVSQKEVDSYKEITSNYDSEISINNDCIISAYSYSKDEVSSIIHYKYQILKSIPDAAVINSPLGTGAEKILRWDDLFNNDISWIDTLSGRALSYYLQFDFYDNGNLVKSYSINNGNKNSLRLTSDQIENLKYNDSILNMKVVIKDNYGSIIKDGIPIVYKYTHKYIFNQSVNLTVLSVNEVNNKYFITSAGPDPDNGNKIGVRVILSSFDYKTDINTKVTTDITDSVTNITGTISNNIGAVFFNTYDGNIYKIYPIFNIVSNSIPGTVGLSFSGINPFVKSVNNEYYLIFMRENSGNNEIILRKYLSSGIQDGADIPIVTALSLNDRLISFDYNNGRFSCGIEYIDGVKLYKTCILDNNFNLLSTFYNNSGNEMSYYSSALNEIKCGAVWKQGTKYIYRTLRLSDSFPESLVEFDLSENERPYINGTGSIFHIIYQKNYSGSKELFYINSDSLNIYKRLTSDGITKGFIRILGETDQYAFWLENNNPCMCRIF
jgi:hypothetical protein